MTKVYKEPNIIFGIEGKAADIYQMRRLPSSNNLIINHKYEGIKVIDPWQNGIEVLSVNFVGDYASSGVVGGWCVSSDGKTLFLMDGEGEKVSLLSLGKSELAYNEVSLPCDYLYNLQHDTRYYWEDGSFWITGGHRLPFYKLEWHEQLPVFVETTSIKARIAHRKWVQTIDKIPTWGANVYRIHPDLGQIIYHIYDKEKRIGMVNWKDGSEWSAPAPEYAPLAAYHNKKMFYILDRECYQINDKCEIEASYPLMLPDPYEYRGLEILPASETTPAALVLMANSSDKDGLHSRFLMYKLEN